MGRIQSTVTIGFPSLILALCAFAVSCASEPSGGSNDTSAAFAGARPMNGHAGRHHGSDPAISPSSSQGDGATQVDSALSVRPQSIAIDRSGAIIIADEPGNRILRIDAGGKKSAIAGSGRRGYSGDGGPAVLAELSSPSSVAPDEEGNIYLADSSNNVIRKIDAAGVISTVAGNGRKGDWETGGPPHPRSFPRQQESPSIVTGTSSSSTRETAASEKSALMGPSRELPPSELILRGARRRPRSCDFEPGGDGPEVMHEGVRLFKRPDRPRCAQRAE